MKPWAKFTNNQWQCGVGDYYCAGKTFSEAYLRWINAVGQASTSRINGDGDDERLFIEVDGLVINSEAYHQSPLGYAPTLLL